MSGDSKSQYCIFGQQFDAPLPAPGLYVVATPIGNLGDISIRALQTLAGVDQVLCEDTRQSARLLDHYLIKTSRVALHEHNERAKTPSIIAKLKAGARLALISDAGTPLISDPGFPLVRAAREAEIDVFTLPGASALLGALSISGLPTDRFTFVGFLPVKQMARETALTQLLDSQETLVFYESARRLSATISSMNKIFGASRHGAISLELTKKFERTHLGTMEELAQILIETPPKGEVVIVVKGADAQHVSEDIWRAELDAALKDQPLKGAVDQIRTKYQLRRKMVYDAALEIKG